VKAKRQQQHEIGLSVVATGRGVLSLSPSISANVFCTWRYAFGTKDNCWKKLKLLKLIVFFLH